jgi:hypothetical protein
MVSALRTRVVIVMLAAAQPACATMFAGPQQKIAVRAYPEDAEVKVDGKVVPQGEVELLREKNHVIEVSKSGYQPRRITTTQDLNGWFFANLALLPFFWVGMLVDAMTGSIQELSPGNVTVSLDPAVAPGPPGAVASTPPPPPPPKSSSDSFSVTFVTPVDPLTTSRGTGMNKSTPPPPPSAATPAGPSPSAPSPTPAPTERKRPSRTTANANQQTWVLAVMDAETSGKKAFEKDTLLALTDQIRVFLAERSLRVIDRSSQDAAMRSLVQEEKARSYKTCVDQSCQIPLGKALAASHLMRSTIARFGAQCATNGELIDLRSEVTVAAGSARSGCEEEDLLYAAEALAEQLVTSSANAKP